MANYGPVEKLRQLCETVYHVWNVERYNTEPTEKGKERATVRGLTDPRFRKEAVPNQPSEPNPTTCRA